MDTPPAPAGAFALSRNPAIRWWLVALSLAAGLACPFVQDRFGPGAEVLGIMVKGLAVGALALAALLAGRRWLAAIMAAGAVGDVLLEIPGLFMAGAGSFAVGHVIAMAFYSRHRRQRLTAGDRLAAAALIGWGLAMPGLVMPDGKPVGALMLYSVLLCGMAAAALISTFPRACVAAGGLLFVVSDTLLIMRMGDRLVGGATVHGLLVWFTYYLGQFGIFSGISAAPLRKA